MTRILRRLVPVLALAFVFSLATAVLAADAKGKIKTVNADKSEFVMTDDTGKSITFSANKDCKVRLNDKEAKLSDLQADDMVEVKYEKDGEKMAVSEIKATRK